MNVLILGGTSEARMLATRASQLIGVSATLSLAGRTAAPLPSAVPQRIGGFGGTDGLEKYLRDSAVDLLVDATHPFAEIISRNAAAACEAVGCARVGLMRPAWTPQPGDRWTAVADLDAAVAVLPDAPAHVFLSVGRQSLQPFADKSQHHYLIRVIDPPDVPAAMTSVGVVVGRGPFRLSDELELLRAHEIDWLVTKNSGAAATQAKLDAARELKTNVIMIDRPERPDGVWVQSVDEAVAEILQHQSSLAKRSV